MSCTEICLWKEKWFDRGIGHKWGWTEESTTKVDGRKVVSAFGNSLGAEDPLTIISGCCRSPLPIAFLPLLFALSQMGSLSLLSPNPPLRQLESVVVPEGWVPAMTVGKHLVLLLGLGISVSFPSSERWKWRMEGLDGRSLLIVNGSWSVGMCFWSWSILTGRSRESGHDIFVC